MAIQQFLAMTGAEISKKAALPPLISWMACQFSPSGTGLSNLPKSLPPGSMVILNDQTPVSDHDPQRIKQQLAAFIQANRCAGVLLDLQRPDEPRTASIVEVLVHGLPCPVGVSEPYAHGLACPVFLPPVPPHIPIRDYLAPWQGREIWLEAALDASEITVTADGSSTTPLLFADPRENTHRDTRLHCHYHINVENDRIRFHLYRTPEDLTALLTDAESTNITRSIGLYQELGW